MCIRTSIVLLLTLIGHFGYRIKSGNFLVLKKLSSHKLVLKSPNKEAFSPIKSGKGVTYIDRVPYFHTLSKTQLKQKVVNMSPTDITTLQILHILIS